MASPSGSDAAFGLSLPSRRANITVTRNPSASNVHAAEDADSVGPLSRDSLEGTRRYYGVSPSPDPNAQGVPRQRTISAATNSPRPLSATQSDSSWSLRSPPRGSVPLPVPRGFLAPQKPAAARRLEQRERSTTVSTSGRQSTDIRTPDHGGDLGTPNASDFSHTTSTGFNSPVTRAFAAVNMPNRSGTPTGGNSGTMPPPPVPVGLSIANSSAARAGAGAGGAGGAATGSASNAHPTSASPLPSTAATPSIQGVTPLPLSTPTKPQPGLDAHDRSWDRATDSSSPPGGLHPDLSSEHLVDPFGIAGEKLASRRPRPPPKAKGSPSELATARTVTNVRRYKMFENKNVTWLCGGRLMTGGDSPLSFIISIVLLLGIAGVWVGTTGVWLWKHAAEYGLGSGAGIAINIVFAYMFGLTVSSMIAASFREPGILPRDLDPDPVYTPVDVYWEANPREIRVGKDGKDRVQVKYCETCKSYRPPRSSHCRLCGNCVEGIDHHCAYLHGCIGRRNYFSFMVFIIATSLTDIYIVVFSAIHFSLLCHHDHIKFKDALAESPGAAVSFGLGVLTLPPILFMVYYHVRLLLFNLTTVEQIRASASSNLFRATQRPYNPFAAGSMLRNMVVASIGRPQFPSWVDGNGYVVEDHRRVNPALTTPEKYLDLV